MKNIKSDQDGGIWGYARVSSEEQSYERQKADIHEYANKNRWQVDRIIHVKVSSRKEEKQRGIDVLRAAVELGEVQTVIFSELSRLGRSVGEIARLVDYLVIQQNVALHFIKPGWILKKGANGKIDMTSKIILNMFSLLAEMEQDLISERTKSALAARKAQGVRLGRREGVSKLDKHEREIREWLELGVTQKAIAKKLHCTEEWLSKWMKRKRIERPRGRGD